MVITEREFKLKDGRTAVIRSPRDEDVQGMLDYLYKSAAETEFILRYPEECVKYTPEGEKALFDRVNVADNEAMLVCTVDGVLAGNCQIVWKNNIKARHRASFAIALLKEFWGLGIGTKFFEELIKIAEDDGKILQCELEFIEGNSRARALYEKMGFRIAGVHPNAIRLKDGTMLNEYLMIKELKR